MSFRPAAPVSPSDYSPVSSFDGSNHSSMDSTRRRLPCPEAEKLQEGSSGCSNGHVSSEFRTQ